VFLPCLSGHGILCTSKAKRGTCKDTGTKAGLQDNYKTCSSFISNELIQVQVATTNGGKDNPSLYTFSAENPHISYPLNSLHSKKNPGHFVHAITVKEITPFIPFVTKSKKLSFGFGFHSMLRFYTLNALKLWHMQVMLNTEM
jgi:hypothetical protein